MADRRVTVTVSMRNKLSAPAKRAAKDLYVLTRAAQLSGKHFERAGERYDTWNRKLRTGRPELTKTSRVVDKMNRRTVASSKALDRQSSSFGQVDRSARRSSETLRKFRMANSITGASRGLDRFSRKTTAAFKEPVRQALEFGKGIAEVSTLTDEATFSTDKMRQITLGMAKDFGGQTQHQTKALYDTISAGFGDVDSATKVLTASNKLAVGGVTDVATAGDGLTSVLNAWNLSADRADDVTDTFFATVKAGKTTVPELSRSLGKVAPTAAALGIEFTEVGGALAALTAQGIKTSEAATGIRGALSNIKKPSKDAQKEAKRLGIEFNAGALAAAGGLDKFLKKIVSAEGFNRDSFTKLFGSIQGGNAVVALAANGFAGMDKALAAVSSRAGATDAAFKKIEDTDFHKLKKAEANLQALKIQAGEALLPALVDMGESLSKDVIPAVSGWMKENEKLVGTLTPVAVGAVGLSAALSPVLLTLSSGITVVSSFTGSVRALDKASLSAIPTLGKLATKANAAKGALMLGKGAVLAGTFFAAYELGAKIDEKYQLSDKLERWATSLTTLGQQMDRLDARNRMAGASSNKELLSNAREDLRLAKLDKVQAEEARNGGWLWAMPALGAANYLIRGGEVEQAESNVQAADSALRRLEEKYAHLTPGGHEARAAIRAAEDERAFAAAAFPQGVVTPHGDTESVVRVVVEDNRWDIYTPSGLATSIQMDKSIAGQGL